MTAGSTSVEEMGGELLAHGLGGRSDLPVAPWLATYAGAVVVAVSFFAVSALWTRARYDGGSGGVRVAGLERVVDAPSFKAATRTFGVLLLTGFLSTAFIGPDDMGRANPAPTWFYVWFWVGLVPASLLLGPVWRRLNPLRPAASALRRLLPLRAGTLPDHLGYAPAAIFLSMFLWLELVYDESASPRVVGWFVLGYAAVHVIAGAVFGPGWFDRADGFEVYSTMLARAAVIGRNPEGALVLRNPLRGLAGTASHPSLTPVVLIVLGSTVFDGMSRSGWWSELVAGTGRSQYLLLGTAGLAGAIALVATTFGLAMALTRSSIAAHPRQGSASGLFAPTLIPIAVGYTIAHYFSFALFQGQQGYLLANDPLGQGWDLFGLAGATVDYALLSTTQIAFVQIGAIVVGHVIAVLAAHDRSLGVFRANRGMSGQYPLLLVMVAYTGGGIILLSGG